MIRHPLSTRLWHWINAAALVVLFMSGLTISNAHRYLYWGDYGFDPADAWIKVVRFPPWATIPQRYDLAAARDWHLLAAWPFAVGLLGIWVVMLINGHFRRRIATGAADWRPAAWRAAIAEHGPRGAAPVSDYNALQKILYGAVFGVLLPLMVASGLAISPGFEPVAPWLVDLLGGRQSARSLHFIAAFALLGFTLLHVALAVTSDPVRRIGAMIGGTRKSRLSNVLKEFADG